MPIAAPHPSLFVTLGVVALIGWRLFARVRRMVGRQTFSAGRAWFTVTVFPLLLLVFAAGSLLHPVKLAALLGGMAAGIGLGVLGLRLTRFEVAPNGLFYTPNAHIGIGLSLLLIGRIGYRLLQFNLLGNTDLSPSLDLARSPLTLAIFATLAGYYLTYAIGLLRWARRADRAALPGPTDPPRT